MSFKQKARLLFLHPFSKVSRSVALGFGTGAALLMIFAKLSEDLLYHELGTFDTVVSDYIRSFSSAKVTHIAIFITHLGSAPVEIMLMLFVGYYLYFRKKHYWETMMLAVNLVGAWLLNETLKVIFHRARPEIQHLVEAGGYSFPSGHAMISASFYGMLGYLLWLNFRVHNRHSWYLLVLTGLLVMAIGVSRIYLGVHFSSDVIAGFAAGGVWLITCIFSLRSMQRFSNLKPK